MQQLDYDTWERTKVALELAGASKEDLEILPKLKKAEDRFSILDKIKHDPNKPEIKSIEDVSPADIVKIIRERGVETSDPAFARRVVPNAEYQRHFGIKKIERIQAGDIRSPEDQKLFDVVNTLQHQLGEPLHALKKKYTTDPTTIAGQHPDYPNDPSQRRLWPKGGVEDDEMKRLYFKYQPTGQYEIQHPIAINK